MVIKNKSWIQAILVLASLFSFPLFGKGEKAATSSGTADIIGAKAFLEELVVRKYSQLLSTMVEKQAFSVGVQVDLAPNTPKKEEKKDTGLETPTDLVVGTIDPEKLIQQFGLSDEKLPVVSILATQKLKSVRISIGLAEDLGEATKAEVKKWVDGKLKSDFGTLAKAEVAFVKKIIEKEKKEKPVEVKKQEWYDWLQQFQPLAAAALLAATLFLSILIWRFTTSKINANTTKNGEAPAIKMTSDGTLVNKGDGAQSGDRKTDAAYPQQPLKAEDIVTLNIKINELAAKIRNDFEPVIRSWCQSGDEGFFKVAAFSEAVGRDLGRLPIPVDAVKSVVKYFAKMAETPLEEKVKILEKVYWDIVTVANFGADVLSQPFSYLSSVETNTISSILMEQNPKMRTIVSLFLPDDVRTKFLKPMSADQKIELLQQASDLNQIDAQELKGLDQSMMGKVKTGPKGDMVPLESSFDKIVSALTPIEEIELLGKMAGPEIETYKRRKVSLAFLHEWNDAKLSQVASRASTDALVAYLRIKETMKDKVISLSPQMTAAMITDELSGPDKSPLEDKMRNLSEFKDVLVEMVASKEIDLTDAFPEKGNDDKADNVVNIRTA